MSIIISLFSCLTFHVQGQIILEADFTDSTKATKPIHFPMEIYNRISPINGFRAPVNANAKLCIVRPLGGKYSKGTADLSQDTYLWDETNQKFYTDFTLLKKQIDGVFKRGVGIHQIVLDNPSWAFQRDSLGKLEGDTLKIETYGNAEPPRDYNAWGNYLKDVINFLIATYGKEQTLKIQFGIGREIGTKGHWTGTKEQFFEFYKKSVVAIHEVLPEAKVGSHFLWESSKKAWGVDFVKWCKTNSVHYDVIGASYYPFYNRAGRTNFTEVYLKDFAPIKDIPDWNNNATFEIHEFALIKSMNKKGNGYESAEAKYQNTFLVGLIKMCLENNIKNLFQWGKGSRYMPAITELLKLKNNMYYKSSKNGPQQSTENYVDAIFTQDTSNGMYKVIAYNYSAKPTSSVAEKVKLSATIDVPPDTPIKYRVAVYSSDNAPMQWSTWQYAATEGSGTNISTITFEKHLAPFSFLTYEFLTSK